MILGKLVSVEGAIVGKDREGTGQEGGKKKKGGGGLKLGRSFKNWQKKSM